MIRIRVFKCIVFLLMASPMLSWAQQRGFAYVCEKATPTFFAQQYEMRHTTQLAMICYEQRSEPVPREQTYESKTHQTTIVTAITVTALPTRVWRLNHWYEWVKHISHAPGKAAPIESYKDHDLSAYAGFSSSKKSWRPAQAQPRRSVMASARSRAYA